MTATSLDRMRPFAESCMLVVVSAQGCGMRSPRPLQIETPIMLSGLPGGASVTAKIVNCVPMGSNFLIGAALYNHGNVWGIANPPEDWKFAAEAAPAPSPQRPAAAAQLKVNRKSWPYNLFDDSAESHPGRK